MNLRIGLAIVAVLCLFGSAAQAGVERLPLSGGPAFEVNVPDGWTASRDGDGNLLIVSTDHTAVVVLNMAALSGGDPTDLAQFAAGALAAAKARPYSRTEPASVGGVSGQAFYTSMDSETVANIQVCEVLVRVDAAHIASTSEIRAPGITATMSQALNDLVARIRFVGR